MLVCRQSHLHENWMNLPCSSPNHAAPLLRSSYLVRDQIEYVVVASICSVSNSVALSNTRSDSDCGRVSGPVQFALRLRSISDLVCQRCTLSKSSGLSRDERSRKFREYYLSYDLNSCRLFELRVHMGWDLLENLPCEL